MNSFLKNKFMSNMPLAVFIIASLVVSTAAASGNFHRSINGGVSQKAPTQTQQQQAAPVAENQAALQSATEGKTTTQSQTVERADISAVSNSTGTETKALNSPNPTPVKATSAVNNNSAITNNNAGTNSISAATTHFSVSASRGDDGSGDDNRGDDGSDN